MSKLRQDMILKFYELIEGKGPIGQYGLGYFEGRNEVAYALKDAAMKALTDEMRKHEGNVDCLIAMQKEVKLLWDYVQTTDENVGKPKDKLSYYVGRTNGATDAYQSILPLVK